MNAYVVPEKTEKQMPQMLVMFCTNWDWSFAMIARLLVLMKGRKSNLSHARRGCKGY